MSEDVIPRGTRVIENTTASQERKWVSFQHFSVWLMNDEQQFFKFLLYLDKLTICYLDTMQALPNTGDVSQIYLYYISYDVSKSIYEVNRSD